MRSRRSSILRNYFEPPEISFSEAFISWVYLQTDVGNKHFLDMLLFQMWIYLLICVSIPLSIKCLYVGNESFWYPNHCKGIGDDWEKECREQIMPASVSQFVPLSPQLCSEWLSASFLSTLTWLNNYRGKNPTLFLAFEDLTVVRGNSSIVIQETALAETKLFHVCKQVLYSI